MQTGFGLGYLILSAIRKVLYLWVRTRVLPEDVRELGIDTSKPVVYVLQRRFLPNALVLARETENLGLPPAWAALMLFDKRRGRSFFFLSHPRGWWRRKVEPYSPLLTQLVHLAHEHAAFEVQIVPVTILWGRAPEHENSVLSLIFSDGWRIRGTFKNLLTVILHGKQTLVRFNAPISLRQLADEGLAEAVTLRKLTRVLRVHFRRQREMAIGPDLSHRRTQINALLAARGVRSAIAERASEMLVSSKAAPDKPDDKLAANASVTAAENTPANPNGAEPAASGPATGPAITSGLADAGHGADSGADAAHHTAAWHMAHDKARAEARKYAWEIASDYSYPMILIFARFMRWVWTRLYDGIEVSNVDTVTQVAADHEIIYVPCHRSHIDYLLMSYIIFQQGLMVPHIAAGANLNLPLVGSILRRSGAFFLRRSFKGNHLYAAVFNEYLHMLIAKGYPIEYFVEGGRSRSGRLLAPMGGMLAMSVHSFLRDAPKPIVFVPAYIGYEKLFEGRTYISELMGRPKKKESLFDLLLTVRELKKNFGKVHVNFGTPIKLTEVLDRAHPDWRNERMQEGERPPWLHQAIDDLRQRIADAINGAAVANPVNLVSLALLATARHAMDAGQLAAQIDGYRRLAEVAPYGPRVKVTSMCGAEIVAYCEKIRLIQRQVHPLGDILYFLPEDAILSTYARNNTLHLFALPALVACVFAQNTSLSQAQLLALVRTVYPFMRAELFLRWEESLLDNLVETQLRALVGLGWLWQDATGQYLAPPLNSDEYAQLALLGQTLRPSLMRYFITLCMLTGQESGSMSAAKLESLCHLQAQRLSLLSEFNAPEFFDKAIFRTLIATLSQRGQIQIGSDGQIRFDDALKQVANEARFVLPPDVRQTILTMARQDGGKLG